jgi:transcription termination factor NusB
MFSSGPSQKQGAAGTAIQAGQDVNLTVNNGMSYSEVRTIALDVFHANLQEFKGIAMQTAQARGEKVTEKFLEKLNEENPEGLQQAQTPDFQDALFTVQKEYAKAGDEELGDLLVDLLVDRTKETERNLLRLVLNESLHTAPKLPSAHVATLSVIFLLRYVQFSVTSPAVLGALIERHLAPTIDHLSTNRSTFSHLEFTGCGTVSLGSIALEHLWSQEYPALFKSGFDQARLNQLTVDPALKERLVIQCLHDATRFQLSPIRGQVLDDVLKKCGASAGDAEKLRTLYDEASRAST